MDREPLRAARRAFINEVIKAVGFTLAGVILGVVIAGLVA